MERYLFTNGYTAPARVETRPAPTLDKEPKANLFSPRVAWTARHKFRHFWVRQQYRPFPLLLTVA